MNFLFKLLLLLSLSLSACSQKDKEISIIKEINQEDEMIQAYRESINLLDLGDTFNAAKNS